MPKIKLPTKSPRIDMTPMVDTFAVILIFLLLTSQMRSPEPANVDMPFSISETPIPDFNSMTFLVSNDGKVYFNIDNGPDTTLKFRRKILEEVGKAYNIEFNEKELTLFEKYPSPIGLPVQNLKEFLEAGSSERKNMETGIPIDSADNQLAMWILYARQVNPNVRATIKADSDTEFPVVQKVLSILQEKNVNRFNLVTSLEAVKINLDEIQK
ncbi:MAG: biopolymer transporter ExbD [Bacteroidetes bacterium]|jgi:biopolymer transport protein ExbD|nr:biopolymer transporter ExbD [Bacteroidota bacterium]